MESADSLQFDLDYDPPDETLKIVVQDGKTTIKLQDSLELFGEESDESEEISEFFEDQMAMSPSQSSSFFFGEDFTSGFTGNGKLRRGSAKSNLAFSEEERLLATPADENDRETLISGSGFEFDGDHFCKTSANSIEMLRYHCKSRKEFSRVRKSKNQS